MVKIPLIPGVCLGLMIIVAPWIWAWLEVRANPSLADAQGAWSLATYVSLVTLPIGYYLVRSSIVARRER